MLYTGRYTPSPVTTLTSKAALGRVSQPTGCPSRSAASATDIGKDRGKVRRVSPDPFDYSDDDPLSDREREPKAKSRKWDRTSPVNMVVVDDDEPLSDCKHKTLVKKARAYTAEEQDALDRLMLRLKSDGRACQYNKEMASLTKYHNENVLDLCKAPNMDDHSVYLTMVKAAAWSYPAKGNLQTVRQFLLDLNGCGDP